MSNRVGYAELIKFQVRIRSDHSTSTKINALTHEISAKSALFAFEPRPDTFDCFPALVLLLGLTCNLVVHDGADVVLQ